jgi:hypothetical protein
MIESRLDCMLELLFFIKPSEVEISSTNFQISVPLDGLDVVLRSFIIIKNKIGRQRSLATNLRLTHQV